MTKKQKLEAYYAGLTKPHKNKIWRFFKRFFNYEKFDTCWNKQQINVCSKEWSETKTGKKEYFYDYSLNLSQNGKHLFCIQSGKGNRYSADDIAYFITILYDRFPGCDMSVMVSGYNYYQNPEIIQAALDRQIDKQRLEKSRDKKIKKEFEHARDEHDHAFGEEGNNS